VKFSATGEAEPGVESELAVDGNSGRGAASDACGAVPWFKFLLAVM